MAGMPRAQSRTAKSSLGSNRSGSSQTSNSARMQASSVGPAVAALAGAALSRVFGWRHLGQD
ncbi:hypothetical protein P7L74_00030 (plasmid) [Tistrella mobilis]|uniref:hypothetical protein n=1 Tax=Tistrella mobilis TaxID=171437 RepID=UPI0035563E08